LTELITEPVSGGVAAWHREKNAVLTNFHESPRDNFAFRMKCINAIGGGDSALGKLIALKHWLVHEVEFVSQETGEVVNTFRTVLVDADGTAVAFVSDGVADGIRHVYSEFGTEPLDPPLIVKVEQRQTAKKRRVYKLIVVPESELSAAGQPAPKKGKK
jgi:hypothetical protein